MLIQFLAFGVLFLLTVGAVIDYKRTVIIWLPVQLLFNPQIAIRYESPAMSLTLAGDIILLLFYFLKKRTSLDGYDSNSFIFSIPLQITAMSFMLSIAFGIAPIGAGFNSTIKYFVTTFGVLFLAQKAIYNSRDIKLFLWTASIVSIAICILALSENLLRDNLWLDFVYFNSPHDISTVGRMFYVPPSIGPGLQIRYGMVRAMSFFGIHIAFGVACAGYFWLMAKVYRIRLLIIDRRIIAIATAFLATGVIMSNSKTGYVGMAFFLLSIYRVEDFLNMKIVFVFLIVIGIVLIYLPEYLNNFLSLSNEKIAEEGGGSTIVGRTNQFEAALQMFEMNPIFGNGPGSIGILKSHGGLSAILGAESCWMQILPERGLIGAVSYLCLFYCAWNRLKSFISKRLLGWFLMGVVVMETATGIIDVVTWGVPLILIYRICHNCKLNHARTV